MANEQEDDGVRLDVAPRLLQPVMDILEGAPVGDVKEQEAAHRVTIVCSGDRPGWTEACGIAAGNNCWKTTAEALTNKEPIANIRVTVFELKVAQSHYFWPLDCFIIFYFTSAFLHDLYKNIII